MKTKSIIPSRTALSFLLGSLAFLGFAVYFFLTPTPVTSHKLWGWISVACAVFFLLSTLAVPLFYVVDKKGIRIRYITGDKENYEWKNVERVIAEYDTVIPFLFDTFLIEGDDYTPYMFYKEGRMERSRALAKAIKHFSDKSVVGFIPSGLSMAEARRFKLSYGKRANTDAAQAAERAARKATREALASLGEKVEGVTVQYQFINADYIGDKRPNIDYAYSISVYRGEDNFIGCFKLLSLKRKGNEFKVTYSIGAEEIKTKIENLL